MFAEPRSFIHGRRDLGSTEGNDCTEGENAIQGTDHAEVVPPKDRIVDEL